MHRSLCYNSAEPLDLRCLFWFSPFMHHMRPWQHRGIRRFWNWDPQRLFGADSKYPVDKIATSCLFWSCFLSPLVPGFHRQVPFRTAGDALLGRRNLENSKTNISLIFVSSGKQAYAHQRWSNLNPKPILQTELWPQEALDSQVRTKKSSRFIQLGTF